MTSGIAILRRVMARQESAAAGRNDGSVGDVVIVGDSRQPVAVMKQPTPWLAVDDTDEEDNCDADDSKNVGGTTGGGRRGAGSSRKSGCRTARRRVSFDESEDPATAISVVSEQLWGLQQKLVGTYMAVARARLGRGYPAQFPLQFPSDQGHVSAPVGPRGCQSGAAGNGGPGSGRTAGRENRGAGGRGDAAEGTDSPDDESRVELATGALDSLCAAWEHLTEAMITLDRRAAGALACEEAAKMGNGHSTDGDTADTAALEMKGNAADNKNACASAAQNSKIRSCGGAAREQRAVDLGPLWAGSLSEALARSGSDADATMQTCNGANGGKISRADGGGAAGDFAPGVSEAGEKNGSSAAERDGDSTRSVAWDRAARCQLEARRAELFELCGDVAHTCFSLRTAAPGGAVVAATTRFNRTHDSLARLLPRLEGLLASARPPLVLADLDVCRSLHGQVCRALGGSDEDGTTSNVDPPPLLGICIHSLAKSGLIPGDPTAWSLCLAAEACYKQALIHLAGTCTGGDSRETDRGILTAVEGRRRSEANHKSKGHPPKWSDKITGSSFDIAAAMVIEADARLRRKVGDASNELGKLMSHCAGVLVQAPVPKVPPSQEVPRDSSASPENSPITTAASSTVTVDLSSAGRFGPQPHLRLACAVCVACAQGRFRQSLEEFRAIDDARNSALLLCNLASIERLKPRALARLREVCSNIGPAESPGGKGNAGEVNGGTRRDGVGPKRLQGEPENDRHVL